MGAGSGGFGIKKHTIMHIDMDAFFASVEQQCNPHYRGKPIAVIGSGKRTVITTASYPARTFGVKTGMTIYQAKKLCPEIIFVVGNNEKYTDTCVRIVSILKGYTPKIEVYSIDEFFIDLIPCGNFVETAKDIKRRIKEELGFTCSIGIGPNKLIAKLASDMNKPDGLTIIKQEEVLELLETLPVEKLCGIGDKTKGKLLSLGIKTCGELGRTPVPLLRRHFGIIGVALNQMGQGIDNSPVVPLEESPEAKSIGHSMTLEKDELDRDKLKNYLLQLSEMVGRRLRRELFCGKTICLTIRYSNFKTFTKQKTIKEYIKDTPSIYNVVLTIFDSIKLNKAVRLLGVSISNLSKDLQIPLFEDDIRKTQLTNIIDKINDKYGEFTLTNASLLDRYRHKGIISPSWRPEGGKGVGYND